MQMKVRRSLDTRVEGNENAGAAVDWEGREALLIKQKPNQDCPGRCESRVVGRVR